MRSGMAGISVQIWSEFFPNRKGGIIWYTDGSKIKALELGCAAMAQGKNFVFALGSTQQYSRHKRMSLRHVQLRIYIGTIQIETSISYQILKQQLKHLINTRSPQNWSGTAINPSYNWPNITEFNWYGSHVVRVLFVMKPQFSWN
jgi:hypothetical protein